MCGGGIFRTHLISIVKGISRSRSGSWAENKCHREFSESYSEPLKAALFRKANSEKALQKNTATAIRWALKNHLPYEVWLVDKIVILVYRYFAREVLNKEDYDKLLQMLTTTPLHLEKQFN